MIAMLNNKGYGINLCSSLLLAHISIICFLFVDDKYLPTAGAHIYTSGKKLQEAFQKVVDRWPELYESQTEN